MGMVVVRVSTTMLAHHMAAALGVDMPITDAIYQVLYVHAPIRTELLDLMCRTGKPALALANASY